MENRKVVYRVKGDKGGWDYVLNSIEAGRAYLKHIRKTYDKTAKLYEIRELWKEVK